MAYMSKIMGELMGPFPCYKGEFIGNRFKQELLGGFKRSDLRKSSYIMEKDPFPIKTNVSGKISYGDEFDNGYGVKFRIGKPNPSATYSSEQMEKDGLVGCYLLEDTSENKKDFEDIQFVPTPPSLMEPKE